jgi:REP element-mobilizing transposase RayT
MPGAIFHLTARCQGGAAWFTEHACPAICEIIETVATRCDLRLFAYTVMPNHLHLVVQQGASALATLMQPLLRRVALLVQRQGSLRGHIFERPYWATPCMSPEHARNAIVYTHLNPVRAGLCAPGDWEWSSHRHYVRAVPEDAGRNTVVAADYGLALFGDGASTDAADLPSCYARFEAWRLSLARDDGLEPHRWWEEKALLATGRPSTDGGDRHWEDRYGWLFQPRPRQSFAWQPQEPRPRADLRDTARAIAAAHGPGLDLEHIRGRAGGPTIVRVRHAIIRQLAADGHRGRDIAAFLRISPSRVSEVRHRTR